MHFAKVLPIAAALAAISTAHAAAINPGDLVIYRVGDGASALTSAATQVFLDEYSTSGALVQSIAMPTSLSGGNYGLTASGTASSEGQITLSADGQFVVLTGYNAATGTAGVATTPSIATNRTVGLFNVATGTTDTTTHLSDAPTSNNIRSAASTNGTDLWIGGAAGGVRYTTVGSTTSTQLSTTVANIRQVEIFNGQLYASDSSGSAVRLGAVGAGLPKTAGQTITNLSGISASTGSPYSFFMADLNAGVAGMDTLYVADDTVGITKYSFDGTTWTSKGTVGAAADTFRGLTGTVVNGQVDLFATGLGGTGATGGGKLVSFIDTSGYSGTFSAAGTTLATAAANTAFRGVVLTAAVPEPETYAMLLAGLGLLGFAARRRAK
jgi:hypothetical protein